MKIIGILTLVSIAGLLLAGCSDKREEAARLEQEMRQMEEESDSTVGTQQAAGDTLADSSVAIDANAVPVTQEPPPAMPPRPVESGYTVQVASCEDPDFARYLVDLYTDRGYQPYVVTYSEGGTTYYRVRLGLFEHSSEAKALSEELKDRYSIDPWIDQN